MGTTRNEKGSVLVFATLLIVLLMIMVGLGLDTGQLTYVRSQGQTAVDAAALTAVSGLPVGAGQVTGRVDDFNSTNDYVESSTNKIGTANITYVQYNDSSGAIVDLPGIANANGVRVALEQKNPYTGAASGTGITTPVFLTPLLNLFGSTAPAKADISVSAVAALKALPGIPIAIMTKLCNGSSTVANVKLRETNANIDNSCWTTYTENPPSASRVQELFVNSKTCSGLPVQTDLITIGTQIELNNGQQASTYNEAHQLFIADEPGKCWMVPVVPNSTKCNQSDPILDWAKICPTAVVKHTQGNEPKYITVDLTCNQNLFRINDNLCFSPRLVRDTKSGM
jgi:Flp pilus assembly protein TadG